MATLAQKIEAETRMRELLAENGLPTPDHVEYGYQCVRFYFSHTKHVVVVDIDDPGETESTTDTCEQDSHPPCSGL